GGCVRIGIKAEVVTSRIRNEQRVGNLRELRILNRYFHLVPEACFEQFVGVEDQVDHRHEIFVLLYARKHVILKPQQPLLGRTDDRYLEVAQANVDEQVVKVKVFLVKPLVLDFFNQLILKASGLQIIPSYRTC